MTKKRTVGQFHFGNKVYRIFNNKNVIVLSGLRRSGKTTMTRSIIASCVSEQVIDGWDIKTENGVHVIDTEMSPDLVKELQLETFKMSKVSKDKFKQRYSYKNITELNFAEDKYNATIEIIKNTNKDLIIIDNLSGICNDPNNQSEASKIAGELNSLAFKLNKTITVVAHHSKDDTIYGVVGNRILDIASFSLSFKRSEWGYTLVENNKDRYELLPDFDFSVGEGKRLQIGTYMPFPTIGLTHG